MPGPRRGHLSRKPGTEPLLSSLSPKTGAFVSPRKKLQRGICSKSAIAEGLQAGNQSVFDRSLRFGVLSPPRAHRLSPDRGNPGAPQRRVGDAVDLSLGAASGALRTRDRPQCRLRDIWCDFTTLQRRRPIQSSREIKKSANIQMAVSSLLKLLKYLNSNIK